MAPSPAQFTIFISYARTDAAWALAIYNRLRAAGFDVWLDTKSIRLGEEWVPAIERGLRESQIVLVLLSSRSFTRNGFLQREVHTALEIWKQKAPGTVYLIPARLEDCPKHERLAHLHWVDLFNDAGWTQLSEQLRAMRLECTGSAISATGDL